jgi:hypothetical protein
MILKRSAESQEHANPEIVLSRKIKSKSTFLNQFKNISFESLLLEKILKNQ